MSERETSIHLPGNGSGLAWGGRQTTEFMIAEYRKSALYSRDKAQAVLDAPDDAFRVETYRGPYARRALEVIQEGSQP